MSMSGGSQDTYTELEVLCEGGVQRDIHINTHYNCYVYHYFHVDCCDSA